MGKVLPMNPWICPKFADDFMAKLADNGLRSHPASRVLP
jgi:hypothetical protein